MYSLKRVLGLTDIVLFKIVWVAVTAYNVPHRLQCHRAMDPGIGFIIYSPGTGWD